MPETDSQCPHRLKGASVERTTHMDNCVIRERVCSECAGKIITVEQDREEMEENTREKEGRMRSLEWNYNWAMDAIRALANAKQEVDRAYEGLIKINEEHEK